MSAPTTRDPLVVNTQDGSCWTRRAVTREGRGLYALADVVAGVPDEVLASLAELAEHGLASMADALPMPVGAKPLELSEQQIEALAAAGNRVVNDATHEHLCMCDAWPEKCVSTGHYYMGTWDVDGLEAALPAVLALWEQMRGGEIARLQARVAELAAEREADHKTWRHDLRTARDEREATAVRIAGLEAERHSTNEALDDAVKALRADRSVMVCRICEAPVRWVEAKLSNQGWWNHVEPAADGHGITPKPAPSATPDGITQRFAPTQALRDPRACEACGTPPEKWCPDCAACKAGCFGGFNSNSCSHSKAPWGGGA